MGLSLAFLGRILFMIAYEKKRMIFPALFPSLNLRNFKITLAHPSPGHLLDGDEKYAHSTTSGRSTMT
ncbi:hypothetical protein ACHAXS_012822 [Conticribra weissflogii]